MKRFIALSLVLLTLLALCACGADTNETQPSTTAPNQTATDTPMGYPMTYNNVTFGIGMKADGVLDALGEAKSRVVSASCAFGGNDIVYDYQSVKISANDENGYEMIYCIELVDDMAQTQKGIKIGSTKDAVIAAYGDATKTVGVNLLYEKDGMELRFLLKNDKVTSIQYILPIAG
jgi:hypothetical protein